MTPETRAVRQEDERKCEICGSLLTAGEKEMCYRHHHASRQEDEMLEKATAFRIAQGFSADDPLGIAPEMAAFARQEVAAERQRVIEEACKIACKGCRVGIPLEAGTHSEFNRFAGWSIRDCQAVAIRKLGGTE